MKHVWKHLKLLASSNTAWTVLVVGISNALMALPADWLQTHPGTALLVNQTIVLLALAYKVIQNQAIVLDSKK